MKRVTVFLCCHAVYFSVSPPVICDSDFSRGRCCHSVSGFNSSSDEEREREEYDGEKPDLFFYPQRGKRRRSLNLGSCVGDWFVFFFLK